MGKVVVVSAEVTSGSGGGVVGRGGEDEGDGVRLEDGSGGVERRTMVVIVVVGGRIWWRLEWPTVGRSGGAGTSPEKERGEGE
ncbi:hypothetical protein Tco_0314612 [Tanacetum coccineum]